MVLILPAAPWRRGLGVRRGGGRDRVEAPPFFDAAWYRAHNADVAAAGLDPWRHWLRHGRAEGRPPAPLDAPLHEGDLWRGFPAGALDRLEALARGGPAGERILAAWALARWRAARGEWEATAGHLRAMRGEAGWTMLVAEPGPSLLAARAFARAGAPEEARAALRALPPSPDRRLAEADAARALGLAGPEATVGALSAALVRAGIEGIVLGEGSGAPIDRLTASPPGWRARLRRAIPGDPPLVSVVVPARDAEATLGTALGSLLAQSWPALEILVVENGSRDGTLALARAWAARDPRVRALSSDEVGTYPARNLGLAETRGAYLTVHDADDWSHPRKIEAQMRPFLGLRPPVATASHLLRATPELELSVWRQEAGFVHRNTSSLLFRTELREGFGYWDRVRVGADTELYFRLRAAFGDASVVEVMPGLPLSLARVTPASLTQRPGTHLATQLWGPRRAYHDAARRWHARTPPEALRMPRRPARRPFDAPDAVRLGDAPAELEPDDRVRRSPLFDARWYLETYEDVRRAEMDAALHYVLDGAAGGRDPGPGFSSSGWRAANGLGLENPLLDHEDRGRPEGADPLPRIPGRLAPGRPRALVFGHQAEATLFGAERSLLDMLDRLAAEGLAPVTVLPRVLSDAYLDAVLARSEALHVVPYRWWRADRQAHPVTIAALRRILARERPVEAHVNTLVIDAPLLAARAEGVPSVVHVREMPPDDPEICEALGAGSDAIRARLLASADRFVANSAMVARWLDAPGRVTVRGNAVDPALFGSAARGRSTGPLRSVRRHRGADLHGARVLEPSQEGDRRRRRDRAQARPDGGAATGRTLDARPRRAGAPATQRRARGLRRGAGGGDGAGRPRALAVARLRDLRARGAGGDGRGPSRGGLRPRHPGAARGPRRDGPRRAARRRGRGDRGGPGARPRPRAARRHGSSGARAGAAAAGRGQDRGRGRATSGS